MDKDVVVNGATIECTGGTHRSFLVVPPSLKIEVDAANAANITHHKPANILNFGLCKLQRGFPRCEPKTPSPWTRGEPSIEFGVQPVLDTNSTCKCDRAPGEIRVVTSGQRNPFLSVNCRKPYSTLAEEAAEDYRRRLRNEYLAQLEAEQKEENKGPSFLKKAVGFVIDLTIIGGTAKGIDEAITGWDIIYDKPLSGLDRYAGIIPFGRRVKKGVDGAKKRILGEGGEEAGEKEARERAAGEATEGRRLKRKERRERERAENAERRGRTEGSPRSIQAQRRQFNDAARGLTKDQRRRLHDEITRQNMTREEIIERRNDMFPGNPYPGS